MFIVFTCGASQFDSYWFGFLFNHHKPPKKEKKRRNHHCPDEDARLRHLITVFVAGSKHASNWHLFPGCVDRHRRFVSMSHFTFSICPEAGLYIFLLTVCLHARGFILCVLTFHPHRKWSFPPPETLFCVYMWTRKTRILACKVKLVHLHLLFQCQTVSHFIALTGPPMATIGQHLYTARPWVTTCWYQILHTHIKWHINRKLSHAI